MPKLTKAQTLSQTEAFERDLLNTIAEIRKNPSAFPGQYQRDQAMKLAAVQRVLGWMR